jgi:hypothetical protein
MLTVDDLQNAINAIEGARYAGKDAAAVAAMLGRFRAALDQARRPVMHRVPAGALDKTGTDGG